MNPAFNTIDYISNSFVYTTLTKIHGYPTFVSLTILKSNARAVSSDLGGGAHGHLGLILSPQEYALVSPMPYVFLDHPSNFNLQQTTKADLAMIEWEA